MDEQRKEIQQRKLRSPRGEQNFKKKGIVSYVRYCREVSERGSEKTCPVLEQFPRLDRMQPYGDRG